MGEGSRHVYNYTDVCNAESPIQENAFLAKNDIVL